MLEGEKNSDQFCVPNLAISIVVRFHIILNVTRVKILLSIDKSAKSKCFTDSVIEFLQIKNGMQYSGMT